MSKNIVKKFAIGTLIAAIAGYLAGILTAPKSGKETREDIKDVTVKGVNEAEKQLKRLQTELAGLIDEARLRTANLSKGARRELDVLTDKAKDSKEKAQTLLTAIHDGDTDDKDLDKAIKDATKAVEHIRAYLTK